MVLVPSRCWGTNDQLAFETEIHSMSRRNYKVDSHTELFKTVITSILLLRNAV